MIQNVLKYLMIGSLWGMSQVSYANATQLSQMESNILHQYKDAEFFEVNADIESEMSFAIKNDASSFNYDFSKLQKAGYVHIDYSPDKTLKFYNFDISGGGTMGEWSNYVQYFANNKLYFDEFSAGRIEEIHQVKVGQKIIYLVESYYKDDNCHGAYALRAVEVGQKQLLKSYLFLGKNKEDHEIMVDFDCQYVDLTQGNPYFRIQPKAIDIMLLNAEGIPQNKYLRYQLGPKGYTYSGIVK